MVKGDIHSLDVGTTSVTPLITGIPTGNFCQRRQWKFIALNTRKCTAPLTITFLGAPALGEDGETDYNPKVDDVQMEQCRLTSLMLPPG